jgi:hypothetical protein
MSEGVINSTVLDYCLIKYYRIPQSNTVKFCAGFLFPNNKTLVSASWSFGDSSTSVTPFSANQTRYDSVVSVLETQSDFFPRWDIGITNCVRVLVPKFEVDYTYSSSGSYSVNVTLVDSDGNSYTGVPAFVDVPNDINRYTVPLDWNNISQSYKPSNDINYLAKNGVPEITTSVSSTSSIPIDVSFNISNLVNRLDVDYIEWNFGDGTADVKSILQSIVIPEQVYNFYSYKLIPTTLVYEPQVTVYFSNKTKYKLQIPTIPLIDISNISVGINESNNFTVNATPNFNITPIQSYVLPVDTHFTHIITKNLKYIIWNYSDSEFEVYPVTYTSSLSNFTQTIDIPHKYTSLNYYNFLPKCVLVYENNGAYTAERYRSKKQLNYQLGLLGQPSRGETTYVISTTNYQRNGNISTLIEYPPTNTGYARLYLRLSLDLPIQILYFEKIVWVVDGQTIIQDKNTSKSFGKLTIEDVTTSIDTSKPISITATLYGRPALYANDLGNNSLVSYDTYERIVYVIDKDLQESYNEQSILIRDSDTPIFQTIITTEEGVEIITPIIDSNIEVIEEDVVTYVGSNIVFNTLFNANNPAGNFLNRLYPTVAAVPSDLLVTKRVIGFFKPSKTAPIVVDPGKFTFSINLETLEYDKPYYFPDPYKYGSNTSAINFYSLDQSFKKNARYGKARNEPNQPQDSVTYYGYNSIKSRSIEDIYNQGYIHDEKKDIFGNIYGLVKDNLNFRENIPVVEPNTALTLQLNGYKFYDDIFGEANTFNYRLTGVLGTETIRSGLSSTTNGFSARSTNFYLLNFGDFKRIAEPSTPTEIIDINTQYLNPINVAVRDGAYFTLNNSERLTDTISSDLSTFPGSGSYYFKTLLEAGAHNAVPYERPYQASIYPSFSAIFTENVRVSANNGVIDIDGGLFVTDFNVNDNFFESGAYLYVNDVNPLSLTTFLTGLSVNNDTISERNDILGNILIKDITGNYGTIFSKLDYLQNKYSQTVYSSLTGGILNFDFVYDTYFIQTSRYLICDKISFDGVKFSNPKTPNIVIPYGDNLYNTISNRYKVGDTVYFATLSTVGTPNTSTAFVYPIIYKLNINTLDKQQIFPDVDINNYSDDFLISTDNILYTESDVPSITYNSDLELFNVSYLLKDQNKVPYLMSVNFKDTQSGIIDSTYGFKFGSNNISTLFNAPSSINSFTPTLTSGSISITTHLYL